MITNKTKEEACIAFKTYLKLIYWLGRGVMLTIHIQRFMETLEGKNKIKVWRDLRELQAKKLIDIHKIHSNNYVKLKKYALKYLLNKDSSENTKSIKYNLSAIKKSAFICEYILVIHKWKGNRVEGLLSDCYYNTTLLNNTALLKECSENNDAIKDEIENLEALAAEQLQNFKTQTNGLKVQKYDSTKKENENLDVLVEQQLQNYKTKTDRLRVQKLNKFNIINMQSRNIYIDSVTKQNVNVIFFDMSDNYSAQKLGDVFQKVYDYLFFLFEKKKFCFNIITSDAQSVLRLKKHIESLRSILQSKRIYGSFTIRIINLDIRAKAFSNVKILL